MPLIQSEDAATKLARAIATDIRLYNAEGIERGDDLSEAMQEGRELFQARVHSSLHAIYERALSDAQLGSQKHVVATDVKAAPAGKPGACAPLRSNDPFPLGMFQSEASERRASASTVPLVVTAILIAVGIGFWLVSR
jgi:hypothetical protein